MKLSMTGQEKGDLFNTVDCLIEVTAWAGLTVIFNMESDNLNTSSLIRQAAILMIM